MIVSAAVLLLVCVSLLMVLPRIRRSIFRHSRGGAVPTRFVDRLKGVPYSKSDYNGIDVSQHQGIIKWDEAAKDSHIQFVYIRSSFGTRKADALYQRNVREARKAGLKIGSYHFLTSASSMHQQFRLFASLVDKSKQNLIPMVDVEEGYFDGWTRQQLQDSLAVFVSLVKKHYGCLPMIYSGEAFYNDMLAPRFNHHILYLANYSRSPAKVKGRHIHNLWQYSRRGHIRGIGEYVDLCRFVSGSSIEDIRL